jgi:rhodanese-related sulfurtransferase
MKWSSLTLNQKLAALALALGTLALASQPQRGPFVRLDAAELAAIVDREVDHVTPTELAAWIIEGRADYRLLDLRSPAEFATYHIPTAENLPMADLARFEPLPGEKIVLYSGGGIHAAQAWMLMRARGYTNVYALLLGLNGWTDDVLYPEAPAAPDARQAAGFERKAAVARFFGGQPRPAGSASEGAATPLPATPTTETTPAMVPPVAGPRVPLMTPRKKREGC